MKRLALVAFGASLVASSLSAQELGCASSETLAACRDRLDSILAVSAGTIFQAEQGADTLATVLAGKTVGIGSLGSGLSSTIGDFLPSLAGALGLTQTTTENGATSIETNLRIPLGTSLQRVRLQALFRKPELYPPLLDSLPAASRDSRAAALRRELNDFDDVQVNAAWNLENKTFGRNFDVARPLVTAILRRKIEEVESTGPDLANQIYVDLLQHSDAGIDPAQAAVPGCRWDANTVERSVPLDCFTAGERAKLTAALVQALVATRTTEEKLHRMMVDAGLFRVPDLINNQPQLSLQAGLDLRRDLAGPNDFAVSARYEGGFTNFNGLRRFGRERCGAAADSAISASCLQRYLADPQAASGLAHGDRFFVSASYTRRENYALRLPADSVNLILPGTWDFTASAGFGRYVTFSRTGDQLGRIDVSADYIVHHDDPTRQNRLVAAGTYTYRITPALSIAAGVSYASKAEFLGDVDKKFGLNFGLRYRIIKS